MNNIFVKYKNGKSGNLSAIISLINKNIKRLTLKADNSFSDIDYIEIPLHSDIIKAGDNGYYLISAGNGKNPNRDFGIGYFKERHNSEYVLEDGFLSVFGISHNGECQIAIVTGLSGSVAQSIKIKDNTYSIALRFNIDGNVPFEDIEVEFHKLKPNADYCDMAKAYRNYQLSHGFVPIRERLTPELKYSVEAVNIRIRMGWKPVPCTIAEQTPENEPPVYVACTFGDVLNIIESYKAAGIKKAEFCLVGWNMKGHDGRWPQILPVEASLGGEEGLKKVIEKAKEYGYQITCHTNSTDSYSISELFDEKDIALTRQGEKSVEAVRWGGGRTYNLCPKRAYEISMETLPEVAKLGFRGMHYIDVITCTPQRECHSKDHPVNKREAGEYFERLFKDTAKLFGSVGCEGAYDHALKNCDYTLYVSFADFTDRNSQFELCEKTIPFWQIVYHGIVPSNPYARTVNALASDNKDDLLKVIEFGGKPQLYYYAQFVSDGTDWIGKGDFHCNTPEEIAYSTDFVKKTADLYVELSYLQYEFIEKHTEISPNVFEIIYSDSSSVTVDYNNKTYYLTRCEK